MTVRLSPSGTIDLTGVCPSEDAEPLLQQLIADPTAVVDWTLCESAHTAVIQVLLVTRPRLQGTPIGRALRDWLAPFLGRRGG